MGPCADDLHDWKETHCTVDGYEIDYCNRDGCRATRRRASVLTRIEHELSSIARKNRPEGPPRLNERTNTMVKRLLHAEKLYIPKRISPASAIRLFARWRDPDTKIISDGVASELQEAS